MFNRYKVTDTFIPARMNFVFDVIGCEGRLDWLVDMIRKGDWLAGWVETRYDTQEKWSTSQAWNLS